MPVSAKMEIGQESIPMGVHPGLFNYSLLAAISPMIVNLWVLPGIVSAMEGILPKRSQRSSRFLEGVSVLNFEIDLTVSRSTLS